MQQISNFIHHFQIKCVNETTIKSYYNKYLIWTIWHPMNKISGPKASIDLWIRRCVTWRLASPAPLEINSSFHFKVVSECWQFAAISTENKNYAHTHTFYTLASPNKREAVLLWCATGVCYERNMIPSAVPPFRVNFKYGDLWPTATLSPDWIGAVTWSSKHSVLVWFTWLFCIFRKKHVCLFCFMTFVEQWKYAYNELGR